MITEKKNKKIVVGVSGGVDSSVALTLLKEKGFSPIGVFMKFWGEENHCCGISSERRARKTCNELNIPFYTLDVRKKFKKQVVDYFLKSYKKGETPNPCIVCNKKIKFKVLFEKISEFGGSKVATGHYAINNKGSLFTPKDKHKDQTYFLWSLRKEDLENIIFPLGDLEKRRVRKLAEKNNLPAATVSDSQEVCFVKSNLIDFLKKHIDLKSGDIENKKGEKLGKHIGLPAYTLGQRKGIGLSGGPFYVLDKDIDRNVLIVTKDNDDLMSRKVSFRDSNFFEEIDFPLEVKAKIRYNAPKEKGVLKNKNEFEFHESQRAIAKGQSIVFYKKDKLLGGGVIN
ncbi:MAG: tRNA 2-thiouridine(34) synthase MnmA [Patescibacteria group bacterium]